VEAKNRTFYTVGNGSFFRGKLTKGIGSVWSNEGDMATLINCNIGEVSMRGGGYIIANGTIVDWMTVADRGKDFKALFTNSVIKSLSDSKNGNGIIYLDNSPVPPPAWGQPYRPEIIKQLER